MKEKIKASLLSRGASAVGVCPAREYSELLPQLKKANPALSREDLERRINPRLTLPGAKSVITFIVSYKSNLSGNISTYAYGKDYHKVLPQIARDALSMLRMAGFQAEIFSDTGDLCDRYLAYLSGLGFYGKNHLLIHPQFGSFVFIGYILTDCLLSPDKPLDQTCLSCQKCINACPTQALSSGDFSKCLSHITQKKGELSPKEQELIKAVGCIWGCDICQKVCPHNQAAPTARLEEFSQNLITNLLIPQDISNREFKEIYGDRAFSWRGKKVILRNQKLIY